MKTDKKIGILLLAAGASTRFGQPKQLKVFKKKSLLQHSIDQCSELDCSEKMLVLGANAELILKNTALNGFNVALNENWAAGMGGSLAFGLKQLLIREPALDHVLILLADQPFVTTQLLKQLITLHLAEEKPITASTYSTINGVPALFSTQTFSALMALTGDSGARKIINNYPINSVDFAQGKFDIDTAEDYQNLLNLDDNKLNS